MGDPTEEPPTDKFGPPHAHQVSDTLQLWILIPGLLILIFVGKELLLSRLFHLLYMVLTKQGGGPSVLKLGLVSECSVVPA